MAGNYNFKEETGEMQFDAQGNLKVNIQAGAAAGGTSSTDDAAFTAGSGSGTPMMGFVTADTVDSGDVGVVGMLANRQLKVTLYDSAGAELAVGGGTQYTEDAASAANPTGTVPMLVRQDTPASEVSTNGDNIAQRATQYGAAYTQIVSSTGSFIDTFGGGTQYTEGDTDATITGTAMLMEGAGNALVVAQGTAADGLLVNLGSNNDVTVTGTVTANLAAGTNNIGDVDVLSVPAPLSTTGGGTEATALRVTIANDSTGVVSIDDNGGAITVDGSVTVSATNLDIRDLVAASDAVSVHGDVGILDQLDLTNSNPAVVAIVDSNGDQITSFGGGTQYTEDAAAAANPVGTAVNLVRQDTPATLVSTDGDNVAQRGTNYGAAYVQVVSSTGSFVDTFGGGTQYTEGDTDATITGTAMMMEGAGNALVAAQGTAADGLLVNLGANNDVTVSGVSTLAEQQTQTTHLATIAGDTTDIEAAVELIDDTVATLGTTTYLEATTKGLIIGAIRRDADTTLVDTTNEVAPLQVDANGRLKVEAFSGETLPVSLTSTTITGTVAVTQSGTWDEVGINDSGNSITVDNGGTFAVQESGAALTALQLIDNPVIVDDAAFTPASTSVMMAGFEFDDTTPDSVNEGDAGAARMSANRNIYTQIRDAAGNERGANVNASNQLSVSVDNTVTVGSHAVTNAGTFAVQESGAALTALQVIDNPVVVDDAAFTPATTSVMMAGFEFDDTTPDSVNEGDAGAARMSSNRNIYVQIRDNAGNERGLNVDASGRITTLSAANDGVDIGNVDVASVVPGTGATNLGKAEDGAHTTGDVGVMALGVRRDTPTVSSGTTGDYEPVSMDANGATWVSLATKLDSTNDAVAIGGRTTGGATIFRSLDLDESEEEVKASAGTVYGAWVTNTATSTRWLKFYNATAANVTVGTTTPVITIGIPGNSSDDISGYFGAPGQGIAFSTAITVAATTGVADADTGAPAANDVIVNIFYA